MMGLHANSYQSWTRILHCGIAYGVIFVELTHLMHAPKHVLFLSIAEKSY